MAEYPWYIFDLPEMQEAMAKARVDRDFIVNIWDQNGPEQSLFVQAAGYNPDTHRDDLRAAKVAGVEPRTWTTVKILYR